MLRSLQQSLLCVAILLALGSRIDAALLINTTPAWNGTSSVGLFGETNSATFGQTFTAGSSGLVLNSFTFFIDDNEENSDNVEFAAYVARWDGSKATGSMLFTGPKMETTNNGGADGFEQFTVDTGNISLTGGQQYVAFFCASNYFDGVYGTSQWGITDSPQDAYDGGNFVYLNNGSNFSLLTAYNWEQWTDQDLAFTINVMVPEPANLAVYGMLCGLGLMGICRRRRVS